MGAVVAITRVAVNTIIGTQDFISADIGGETVVGALFIVSPAITDGVVAAHAVYGVGACTGATEQWCVGASNADNLATTNSYSRVTESNCVEILNPADGTLDGAADFDSFISVERGR
jgi:hypothetical protein